MKLSGNGRKLLACVVSVGLMFGLTSCGSFTIGYLWVMSGASSANGSGSNTITGFKIDNNSGNLTEIVHSPFPSGGQNPTMGLVGSGGRYLYVLNQGDPQNSVSEFSVGGDGVLTFQNAFATQGQTPVWMEMSADQNFLYVLDKVGPDTKTTCPSATSLLAAPCGAITVFSIDPDTGRLALVQNQAIKNNGIFLTYTPVGPSPSRVKLSGTALVVVNGDQTVTSLGATGGQLTVSANSTQVIDQSQTINITSITTGAGFLFLTDAANNRILQYQVSSAGVLQPVTGGQVNNFVTGVTPVWTMTDTGSSSSTNYLYVVNQDNANTSTSVSTIGAYTIQSGVVQPAGGQINPYPSGAGSVCMVEDPSHQWVYISNQDGSVVGKHIDHSNGTLANLTHGSKFNVQGRPACLVISSITS